MNGGTFSIDSPRPYSAVADGLLKTLGVDPVALTKKCGRSEFLSIAGPVARRVFRPRDLRRRQACCRDRRLLVERSCSPCRLCRPMREATSPGSRKQQVDYFPGLSSDEKKSRLSRMSYRDFLLDVVKADPGGHSVLSGADARRMGRRYRRRFGARRLGLRLSRLSRFEARARLGAAHGLYRRRLCRRRLIHVPFSRRQCLDRPAAGAQSHSGERAGRERRRYRYGAARLFASRSSAIAGAHSAQLQRSCACAISAIRLSAAEVEIAYALDGALYSVRARSCVLACYNMMIPYLCPELPDKQKEALQYASKIPLIYASVALRNWQPFKALGIAQVYAPGSYFSSLSLNQVVDIGNYRSSRSPDEPVLVHMMRAPVATGTAGARSASGRTARHSEYQLCDVRARHSRPTRPYPRPRWVRSGARHHGHHRQPLAARLRLRVQSAVRSGLAGGSGAARDRPGALRPDHHRQLGCRCRRLY